MSKSLILMISIAFVLTGCAGNNPAAPAPTAETAEPSAAVTEEEAAEPSAAVTEEEAAEPSAAVTEEEAAEPSAAAETAAPAQDMAKMEIDPAYDINPDEMLPRDFGDFFLCDYDSESSVYSIGEGTEWENEVTVIKSAVAGPVIYVIAGVHGDETAAWVTGEFLEKITIKAGTLYVLAPANKWGASAEPATRYVIGEQDLNRSFPGSKDGTEAEQAASFIFEDVKRQKPNFVFDLHEARIVQAGRDFLGSTLIFTDLGDKMEMLVDMIFETQMGTLCRQKFDYLGPGPEGSVNHTITKQLSIPTITVETFRGYQLEHRVSDQLDIVQYVLKDYGLVD